MKIAAPIGQATLIDRLEILSNYLVVPDDYDFLGNSRVDVTTYENLFVFYNAGRFNLQILLDSLRDNVLPNYNTLNNSAQKGLLRLRLVPSGFTNQDIINEIGTGGLQVSQQTVTESERIDILSGATDVKLSGKTDTATFNSFSAATSSNITTIENQISSFPTDLAVVQTLRTTIYTIPQNTFTDLSFDTTVLENDTSTIEHNDVVRDRIDIGESGVYLISYHFEVNNEAFARVRRNDVEVLDGSQSISDVGPNEQLLSRTFVAELSTSDFISVQVNSGGANNDIVENASFKVVRLAGLRGAEGATPQIDPVTKTWVVDGVDSGIVAEGQDGAAGGGSSIIVRDDGVVVPNSPFAALNFINATATDAGSGQVNISFDVGGASEIQLLDSTGGQSLNSVTPTPLVWGNQQFIDTEIFSHTSGTFNIEILRTGRYEMMYNVNGEGAGNRAVVGVQFRRNGILVNGTRSADYARNSSNNDTSNSIPPFTINLNNGDNIALVAFRLGQNVANSTIINQSFVKLKFIE